MRADGEDIKAMKIVGNYVVGRGPKRYYGDESPRPGFFHTSGNTYYYSFADWNGYGKSKDEVREDGRTWGEYWDSLKPVPHSPWWKFWEKSE